jgi:tRNA A22 N-methylase
MENNKEDLV